MTSNFTLDTLRKTMAAVRAIAVVEPPPHIISTLFAVERKQVRFPRSKKKRIRNKWAKREENYRVSPRIYRLGGDLYAHPSIYQRLLREIPAAQTI
jgi:hypothetical protein